MAVTDTIVDRIIRSIDPFESFPGLLLITFEVTIQTGVLTALFNVLDVVFFLTIKVCLFFPLFGLPDSSR
jgi:hypothetical protein